MRPMWWSPHRNICNWFRNRAFQKSRLTVAVILIQLLAVSWLVYRLKQPHKRVRSLIKHPYHLFNKDQFRQKPNEILCSPDSQEQEVSILSSILHELGDVVKKTNPLCSYCKFAGFKENIMFWKRQIARHNAIQQTCDVSNGQQSHLLQLHVEGTDLVQGLRNSVTAFVAAVLTSKAFVIVAPSPVASEDILVHRSLDWRPYTSSCGQLAAEGQPLSSVMVVKSTCQALSSVLNVSSKALPEHLDLGCIKALLQAVVGDTFTSAHAHAIASSSFQSAFDVPSRVQATVSQFMWQLQSPSRGSASREDGHVKLGHLLGTARIPSNLICIELEPDMLHMSNLWRCARVMEHLLPPAQHHTWVLVGRNESHLIDASEAARHHLHCAGGNMGRNHTVLAWKSPFSDEADTARLSEAHFLSQCSGHVGHSHSEMSKLASLLAGRQYMSVTPGATQSKTLSNKDLATMCKLEYGM